MAANFKNSGRIFLFINKSMGREPRMNTWPSANNYIFATNLDHWELKTPFTFEHGSGLSASLNVSLDSLPEGRYRVQVLWDQDISESRINAPGNLYSEVVIIEPDRNAEIELPLNRVIRADPLPDHQYIREINIKSEILSAWWGKEMRLKAAVVLPRTYYDQPGKKYPVRYNVAGYGGRYTRGWHFTRHMEWWLSKEGPELLMVYLDGEGPFGDCYQMDSENSGPYGRALTEELIPFIEKTYRGKGTPGSRYVEGCSTGGWVSLALVLFYPDLFGGCFSYSPDQVDFENCQLIDIYHDDNAFYNEFGYLRPIVRDITGEPVVSQKDFIRFENVLGRTGTYVTSGGQFSAFTALFSPKGSDGLPVPLFDPFTGVIDRKVAEHWKKYDLKHYVEKNWSTLGPKINGKIWAWTGDMDDYYLNPALRAFHNMLNKMNNPKADATVLFSPMKGHCDVYNEITVIEQIMEKLSKDNPDKR